MLKLRNSQKGLAPILIVLAVLVVGGVGFFVYSQAKDDGGNVVQTEASKAVNDACNTALKDKDFCKFASNWQTVLNYTSVNTSTSNGTTSTIKVETEDANKTRITSTDNGKEIAAYITIGKDFYTKDETDGAWTKYTDTSANSNTSTDVKSDFKVSDFDAATLAKTEYKKIGKEDCGKLSCFKYQIVDKENTANEQFIWFDTKDYLMRRMTISESGTSSDITVSYEHVSISAPTPVKESSSSTITPTQAQIDAALQAAQDSNQ
jgi:outer membrane lipoprotein-sorting protein